LILIRENSFIDQICPDTSIPKEQLGRKWKIGEELEKLEILC